MMLFLKSQISELDEAKAHYVKVSKLDDKNVKRAKSECKRLLTSPKGLGAIAGLGILKGTIGKSVSTKQAGMVFGRRLLSAWLSDSSASAQETEQETASSLSETDMQ